MFLTCCFPEVNHESVPINSEASGALALCSQTNLHSSGRYEKNAKIQMEPADRGFSYRTSLRLTLSIREGDLCVPRDFFGLLVGHHSFCAKNHVDRSHQ